MGRDIPFYDLTKEVQPIAAVPSATHDIEIYELDGAVHIVIKKEDFNYG